MEDANPLSQQPIETCHELEAAIDVLIEATPEASDAEIAKLIGEKFPELYTKYRHDFLEDVSALPEVVHSIRFRKRFVNE